MPSLRASREVVGFCGPPSVPGTRKQIVSDYQKVATVNFHVRVDENIHRNFQTTECRGAASPRPSLEGTQGTGRADVPGVGVGGPGWQEEGGSLLLTPFLFGLLLAPSLVPCPSRAGTHSGVPAVSLSGICGASAVLMWTWVVQRCLSSLGLQTLVSYLFLLKILFLQGV